VCGSKCIDFHMLFSNNKECLVWFHFISVSCFVGSTLSLSKPPQICKGTNCSTGLLVLQWCFYLFGSASYRHVLIQCLFFLFRQLKSDPDLYAGYVPMSYSEYLKKMSKYASICTYAVILFLMIRLLKSLCLLIALCMNVLGVVNGATMSLCRQLQIGYEGIT
jgi:hypothetical protein